MWLFGYFPLPDDPSVLQTLKFDNYFKMMIYNTIFPP